MIILAGVIRVVRGLGDLVVMHHALFKLSRQSPRLIRDMGFEPDDVRAAMNGELGTAEPFRRRAMRIKAEEVEWEAKEQAPQPQGYAGACEHNLARPLSG